MPDIEDIVNERYCRIGKAVCEFMDRGKYVFFTQDGTDFILYKVVMYGGEVHAHDAAEGKDLLEVLGLELNIGSVDYFPPAREYVRGRELPLEKTEYELQQEEIRDRDQLQRYKKLVEECEKKIKVHEKRKRSKK
jgi:hypothetical protein